MARLGGVDEEGRPVGGGEAATLRPIWPDLPMPENDHAAAAVEDEPTARANS